VGPACPSGRHLGPDGLLDAARHELSRPSGGPTYAHEAFGRFPDLHSEPPELRDLGDRILGCGTVLSGFDPDTASPRRIACLFTLRDGQIYRIEAFSTEAQALAAAERASSDRFRLLFQSAREAVFLAADHARLTDANAAACTLFGVSIETIRDRTLFDLVAPASVPDMNELWSRLRTCGQCTGDVEILSASGEPDQVLLRATADFTPSRHVVILSSASSISELAALRGTEPRLTVREQEVFRLLALGLTGSEVAERLFLSPHTVRRHVEKGIARLEAKNRVHAVTIALTTGEIKL
jgi:PAS domain S-box-containing protein